MQTYKHNASHYHLLSTDMGKLTPFCHVEILPNDVAEISVDGLIRLAPIVSPLMHRVKAYFMWFFVSTQQIDSTFPDFITGGVDGNDTTTLPTISTGTYTGGKVYDYLGIPDADNLSFLAHAVRAYNSIYNEYIRDPDLEQTEVSEDSTDLQYINWQKDYFTQARPSEQKGTAVTISVGSSAPVEVPSNTAVSPTIKDSDDRDVYLNTSATYATMDTTDRTANALFANLSSAEGVDVNDLKEAWAHQTYQENRYKFGSRYSEFVKFLGGYDGNASLQRPELLGVSTVDISISEVLQTAPDSGTSTVVGELRGHGIAGVRGKKIFKWFGEHGHLVGLLAVRPELIWTQGLHRKFSRVDKEDYYQPEFANVGWQAIRNKEIYAQGTGGGNDDDATFGYTPRYDEYRSEPNRVSGDFRALLDNYHLGVQLASLPTLNAALVSTEDQIRNSDIFASTTSDTLRIAVNNRIKMRRIVTPKEPMTFQRL
jgi:hypothetical protein